jgi:hypothetical protein
MTLKLTIQSFYSNESLVQKVNKLLKLLTKKVFLSYCFAKT